MMRYKAVVMGVSAGGIDALKTIFPLLPAPFALPIVVVQHIAPRSDGFLADYLNQLTPLTVKEAEDKEPIQAQHIYLAPPSYHLLIETDYSFSLSVDARVNYSCPSIDVLFESAAEVYEKSLIGVVMTGANADGAHGLKIIKEYGGLTVVQNPETAEIRTMPQAAMAATEVDYVVDLPQIAPLLTQLSALRKEVYAT